MVEQSGTILIIEDGTLLAQPFLDIISKISFSYEEGLLGLAFHPDYALNGFFFIDYSGLSGETVIERYSVSSDPDVADASSGQVYLTVAQPFPNHNGGMIAFKPNDPGHYLYVAMGDGGSGGDPGNRAQNLSTLLGKMLRLDIDHDPPATAPPDNPFVGVAGDDFIWAYGLRNPWRWSFDRETGDMFIGDVGQETIEEIDFEPSASAGGENYGWRLLEGSSPFNCVDCESALATTVLPLHEYTHDDGITVIGGYVYRGTQFLSLRGHYFFADLNGRVWSFLRLKFGRPWCRWVRIKLTATISIGRKLIKIPCFVLTKKRRLFGSAISMKFVKAVTRLVRLSRSLRRVFPPGGARRSMANSAPIWPRQ